MVYKASAQPTSGQRVLPTSALSDRQCARGIYVGLAAIVCLINCWWWHAQVLPNADKVAPFRMTCAEVEESGVMLGQLAPHLLFRMEHQRHECPRPSDPDAIACLNKKEFLWAWEVRQHHVPCNWSHQPEHHPSHSSIMLHSAAATD